MTVFYLVIAAVAVTVLLTLFVTSVVIAEMVTLEERSAQDRAEGF